MSNLYSTHASEFSATRQSPWKGWERILNKFKEESGGISSFSVLDIGCGNGRFLEFLVAQEMPPTKYVGLDNSEFLLNVAKSSALKLGITSEFINADLNEEPSVRLNLPVKFDLIVIFGVLHHMENKETIARILEASSILLNPNGILALTFWDFMNSEKEQKKILKEMDGENNYMMSFGSKGAERFVHFTPEDERKILINSTELKVVDEFYADGKSERLNHYFVLKNN